MQKSPNIEINAENPYKHDQLSRQEDIANISNLLQNFSSPITMSITAPWGQGKTTFVKMLEAELNGKNCKSVYFSAWETDFATDPLVAFLGEINETLKSLTTDNVSKKNALNKVKRGISFVAKKSIPLGVKLATYGFLETDKITEKLISKFTGDLSENILNEYTRSKSEIIDFKNNVEKILSNEDGSFKKIYIFIDELDRCRPTYTIELLERIKHLLNIEGLIFILAIDKAQLIESIKGVYGIGFDAKEYLKRFIDIEYKLPKTSIKEFVKSQIKHHELDTLFKKTEIDDDFSHQLNHLVNAFSEFAKIKPITLRDIEQYFTKLSLIIKSTGDEKFLTSILTLYLLILKEHDFETYQLYVHPESSIRLLRSKLNEFFPESKRGEVYIYPLLDAQILLSKESTHAEEVREAFAKNRLTLNSELAPINKQKHAGTMNSYMRSFEVKDKINLQDVISKIEMLSQFDFNA